MARRVFEAGDVDPQRAQNARCLAGLALARSRHAAEGRELCEPAVAALLPIGDRLALMAARRFAPLFWTQFLSAFNDSALKNALVLLVAYRASMPGMLSAEIVIPLAGGLFILPFFLCSATAGQIADQWDKAWLIRLIKLVEIAVMLTTAGFVLIGSVAALLALLFVMGVEAAFFGPLKYAILPDLLAPDELLLRPVEAAELLKISRRQLQRLAKRGQGPPILRLGRRLNRYPFGSLRRWVQVETLQSLQTEHLKSSEMTND